MFIVGSLSLSSPEHVTPAMTTVGPAIVVSNVEDEIATKLPSHDAVLHVLAPLETPVSPTPHQKLITGLAQATGGTRNPTSLLVPLSTLEVEMELTDDVLLLSAVPNYSQAEIMMLWDLE